MIIFANLKTARKTLPKRFTVDQASTENLIALISDERLLIKTIWLLGTFYLFKKVFNSKSHFVWMLVIRKNFGKVEIGHMLHGCYLQNLFSNLSR